MHTEGILLVDKPRDKTSFSLVHALRKKTNVQKIGHTGTLDPFATGLMILLIGKPYTRLSNQFLEQDKEYIATIHLGIETDTFDCDGHIVQKSDLIPEEKEVDKALQSFCGVIEQVPPMFSAKKIGGKKLYQLARQGKTVDRPPALVSLKIEKITYAYPLLTLRIQCSKGTYIRSLAQDLGHVLQCGGHLVALQRICCGAYHVKDALNGALLFSEKPLHLAPFLLRIPS